MGLQIIALAFLIGAIVLGFAKKMNVGIVCLGLALILGKIGGIGAGDIYKGFPYKLFATLLGTLTYSGTEIAAESPVCVVFKTR